MSKHSLRPVRTTKAKAHPYRLLYYLTRGTYGFLARYGDRVVVEAGPLARMFRVSRGRLVEYLEWLVKSGDIKDLTPPRRGIGVIRFELVRPSIWKPLPRPELCDERERDDEVYG